MKQNQINFLLHFKFSIYLFISCVFLSNCTTKQDPFIQKDSKKEIVRYAKNLSIQRVGSRVKIQITNPDQHTTTTYFLSKETQNTSNNLIQIPIQSCFLLSTTHIGMMNKLNELNKVTGTTNGAYVYNSIIRKKIKAGKILEIQDESQLPIERIIQVRPNLIMYSGFGNELDHQKQIEQVGIECMANFDWKEEHPLGKAEWILLFGYLTGKEKEAHTYFSKVEKEYTSLVKFAKKANSSPSVISGSLVGDVWYCPAGKSYNSILFKDAKVHYPYQNKGETGSLSYSFEKILSENKNVDFWANPGTSSLQSLMKINAKYKLFEAFKKQHIFCYSKFGTKFWENAAIEPQHVLSDYIKIFHPELHLKNKLYFYHQLK